MSQISDFLAGRPPRSQIDDFLAGAPAQVVPQEETSAVRRLVADPAISLLQGAIGVPEAAVGLADIATGGHAGRLAEQVGFRPKAARDYLDTLYSPAQQAANAKVQGADGFVDTTVAALQNPSTIVHGALESLPLMGAGGVIGRGLGLVSKLSPLARGAIGEGVVSGGSAAEQTRQQTDDGLLTPLQSAAAVASGAGTAGLAGVGGMAARRLGIADVDTLAAGGTAQATNKGLIRRFAEGALSEGVLEELPQSIQEQMWQNVATGQSLGQGAGQAGAMGMLSGGLMGGGAAALFHGGPEAHDTPPPQPGAAPASGPAAPATGPTALAAPAATPETPSPAAPVPVGTMPDVPAVPAVPAPEGSLTRAAQLAPAGNPATPGGLPMSEEGATRRAAFLTQRGEPSEVVPHPTVAGKFAVVPARQEQADALTPAPTALADATGQPVRFAREDGDTSIVPDRGLSLVHGSGNPALNLDAIQIVRAQGQKQGKQGRVYGGFYATDPQDAHQAQGYADMMGGTPTLYDVAVRPGTKVLQKKGDITRLKADYIDELVGQGYGLVVGKDPRGRTEYAVIDKSAIAGLAPIGAPVQSQQEAPHGPEAAQAVQAEAQGPEQGQAPVTPQQVTSETPAPDDRADLEAWANRRAQEIVDSGGRIVTDNGNLMVIRANGVPTEIAHIPAEEAQRMDAAELDKAAQAEREAVAQQQQVAAEQQKEQAAAQRVANEQAERERIRAEDAAERERLKQIPVGVGDTFDWNGHSYQLTKLPQGTEKGAARQVTIWRDGKITPVTDQQHPFDAAQFEAATGRKLKPATSETPAKPQQTTPAAPAQPEAAPVDWEHSGSFDLMLDDGRPVKVKFTALDDPNKAFGGGVTAHLEFRGPGASETGYRSHFFRPNPDGGMTVQDYAHAYIHQAQAEDAKRAAANAREAERAAKRNAKKVAPTPAPAPADRWGGLKAGDRVTSKSGTAGVLHFSRDGTVAYVTPDVLEGGKPNPDAGKLNARATGAFSVAPGEVRKVADETPPVTPQADATEPLPKLAEIAERLGVKVLRVRGGFHAGGGIVEVPAEDQQVEGAISADHVLAHELGHAVMDRRHLSFKGFPQKEVLRTIPNWLEWIAASKAFRPGVWQHTDPRIRKHAAKPNEIIADTLGSVMMGLQPAALVESFLKNTGSTLHDLGLVAKGKAQPAELESAPPGNVKSDANVKPETPLDERVAALRAKVVRFASGLSRLGDFTSGARVAGGSKQSGVGVDVGELSANTIKQLAHAIIQWRAPIFIDSGAFSAFRRGLKDEGVAPLDFDKILARYDEILQAIQAENAAEETDYPRPLLVMPDVVGDQAGSLALVEKYKAWIGTEAQFNVARPIVPLQRGELSLLDAYRKVVETLGTDQFIVGVPSNEMAVTPEDFEAFLREARPQRLHILGAAADGLTPRLESIAKAGRDDVTITADASPVRSRILRAVAQGTPRAEAVENAVADDEVRKLKQAVEAKHEVRAAAKAAPAPFQLDAEAEAALAKLPADLHAAAREFLRLHAVSGKTYDPPLTAQRLADIYLQSLEKNGPEETAKLWQGSRDRVVTEAKEALADRATRAYIEQFNAVPSERVLVTAVKNGSLDLSGTDYAADFYALFHIDPKKIAKPAAPSGLSELAQAQLTRFNAGVFDLPSNITPNLAAATPKEKAAAKRAAAQASRAAADAYAQAARAFVEAPLTAKVPGKKDRDLSLEFVENARPVPIAKAIAKAKGFEDVRKALHEIAAKEDIRFYLLGLHVEPQEGRLVATDGHRMAVLDDVDLSALPAKAAGEEDRTVLGRDNKWIDARYPDWSRVVPTKHASRPADFNAQRVGDYARALVKAWRYAGAKYPPAVVRIDKARVPINAQYLMDLADLFRRLGYAQFRMSLTANGASAGVFAESPDGKLRQVVMAIRDGDNKTFAPIVPDEDVAVQEAELAAAPKFSKEFRDATRSDEAPEDEADDDETAVDYRGFTREETAGDAFLLRAGDLTVRVEPTTDGYQAMVGSNHSSPRLTLQGAVEWAANYRKDAFEAKARQQAEDEARRKADLADLEARDREMGRFYGTELHYENIARELRSKILDWVKGTGPQPEHVLGKFLSNRGGNTYWNAATLGKLDALANEQQRPVAAVVLLGKHQEPQAAVYLALPFTDVEKSTAETMHTALLNDMLAVAETRLPKAKPVEAAKPSLRERFGAAIGHAQALLYGKQYSALLDGRYRARIVRELVEAGFKKTAAEVIIESALTQKASDSRGSGPMTFIGQAYLLQAAERLGLFNEKPAPAPQVEPPETVQPADAREPWQMTQDEFVQAVRAGRDFPQAGVNPTPLKTLRGAKDFERLDRQARDHHEGAIYAAAQQRKEIPPAVLADYPQITFTPVEAPRYRDIDTLNALTAPIENNDRVRFADGSEWKAVNGFSGRGWTLVRTRDLQGHPKAREIESQVDFIRAIVEANEAAKPAPAESADKPIPVSIPTLPMSLAVQAYSATSHSPEKRGESAVAGFRQELVALWERFAKRYEAATPDRQVAFVDRFNEIAATYAGLYRGYLQSHSRVMSAMIVGPARFPTERNRKRGDIADNRLRAAIEYLQKAPRRLQKALDGPVDNSVSAALAAAREKLAQREAAQARMKAINTAHAKFMKDPASLDKADLSDADKKLIREHKPRYSWEPHPFAPYELSNNNAEIRRQKDRVAELEGRSEAAAQQTEDDEQVAPGVRLVKNAEAGRLQLFFDDKPAAEIRDTLKANGFRWAPSVSAWQRQLTDNALFAANAVLSKHFGVNLYAQRAEPAAEQQDETATEQAAPPAEPAIEVNVAPEALKPNPAAAKLREMADKLEADAQTRLNADRLTNTRKRAQDAAGAIESAERDAQLARTMRAIADALDAGEVTHLAGIKTKAQVEFLNNLAASAHRDGIRQRYPSYQDQERHKSDPIAAADMVHASWPDYSIDKAELRRTAEALAEVRGGKLLANELRKLLLYSEDRPVVRETVAEQAMDVLTKAHGAKFLDRFGWWWPEVRKRRTRMRAMGITNHAELIEALKEFVAYRGERPQADRAKALERKLVGQKVGIDFFPTPPKVARELVELAGIQPGMRVLEPSAGNGNIAEAIRAVGAAPDVVEVSDALREVLEAKGFHLVGRDFEEHADEYDRIVMNPPFSNRMDAAHVQRAYSLLKPGGRLVSIMGEGVFFGSDAKAVAFRDWLESVGGTSQKLPDNTFMDRTQLATTGAAARIVIIDKAAGAPLQTALSLAPGGKSQGGLMEAAAVREVVDRLARVAKERWNADVRLVPTYDALPDNVKAAVQEIGQYAKNPRGVLHQGIVYVIGDEQESPADIEATVYHEIKGHLGVRRLFGDDIIRELNKLWLGIGGLEGLQRLNQARQMELGPYALMLRDSPYSNEVRVAMLMDEALAHLAQQPRFADRVKAIVGAIRAKLREWGFPKLGALGETDLLHVLARAERALVQKTGGNVGPTVVRLGHFAAKSYADQVREVARNASVAKWVKAVMDSSNLTTWQKTVGTQYHKAVELAGRGLPHFKAVFDKAQDFLQDISTFAVRAELKAPHLFKKIDSVAALKEAWQHQRDAKAIADALYQGTLYGGASPTQGTLWTDDELKATGLLMHRARNGFGLNDDQVALYHEARATIDQSLDDMAKALIARHARAVEIDYDRDLSLDDMIAEITERIEAEIEDVLEGLNVAIEAFPDELADIAEMDGDVDDARREHQRFLDQGRARVRALSKLVGSVDPATGDKTPGMLERIAGQARALQQAGYMPLMRFGEHTVRLIDAAGTTQFYGHYESRLAANEVAAALRAEHPDAQVVQGRLSTEAWKLYGGLSLEALELFADYLDADMAELYQDYLHLAVNNRSALRRLIHRQGTPGFDQNVTRTIAQFITSNARHVATSYNLADMKQLANAIPAEQGDVKDEAVRLVEYVTQPQEEAAKLRALLFFQYLGGSVASALVNLTQTPMMTAPALAQHSKHVVDQLLRAGRMVLAHKPVAMPGALGEALRHAEEEGVTQPQDIYQLTATAAGNKIAASFTAGLAMRAWGSFFSWAETFNRRTAFVAAYEIATREKGLKGDAAYQFARTIVNETQGIYNRGNRPNWARGALGSTVMTFKQYQVMYLELFRRLPAREKVLMLGLLALAAGAEGLPFAEDAADLLDTLGQWAGYDTNTKQSMRRAAIEALGKTGADVALNGVSAVLPIDLSGRMGMHNLIPGSSALKQSELDPTRDVVEVLGPAASLVQNAGRALSALAMGELDRAGKALAPTALQNAWKGADWLASGRATDDRGRYLRDVSGLEAGAKALGFNPKSVADESEIRRGLTQDRNYLQVRQSAIVDKMVDSILTNEPALMDEARREWITWNQAHPDALIRIAPATVRARVRAAQQSSAQRFTRALPRVLRGDAMDELQP